MKEDKIIVAYRPFDEWSDFNPDSRVVDLVTRLQAEGFESEEFHIVGGRLTGAEQALVLLAYTTHIPRHAAVDETDFIPLVFDKGDLQYVPREVETHIFDVSNEDDFRSLVGLLRARSKSYMKIADNAVLYDYGPVMEAFKPTFDIDIDPGDASKETIQKVVERLRDLQRAAGDAGLAKQIARAVRKGRAVLRVSCIATVSVAESLLESVRSDSTLRYERKRDLNEGRTRRADWQNGCQGCVL